MLKVYLDISNLDYTAKNFIYVKKDGRETPEKHHCPKKIIESIAAIVHNRMETKHVELCINKNRISLLKKIVKFEDEFVEGACQTLI